MKLLGLAVVRAPSQEGSSTAAEATILSSACDLGYYGMFGMFNRNRAKEFMFFFARTLVVRTPANQRHSVSEGTVFTAHLYNKGGLCAIAFTDADYPVRSAFSVVDKVLAEYQGTFGNAWKSATTDSTQTWNYLNDALSKYQDPMEADKLLKIQRELDDTKIILHKTIDSVLARGERLDSLVEKSSDLSDASRVFYKNAKSANQCCSI